MSEAREEHADQLERELEEMARAKGNPVGHIVRLKAIRPGLYIERQAILTVTAPAELDSVEAAALLRDLLATCSETTRRLLTEGEFPALPIALDSA